MYLVIHARAISVDKCSELPCLHHACNVAVGMALLLLCSLVASQWRVFMQYLAGNTLSVTSLAPRPMNSHFIAAADGSCQAVVQGQVQRQGQWSVAGKCLVETTPDGNKFHALQ